MPRGRKHENLPLSKFWHSGHPSLFEAKIFIELDRKRYKFNSIAFPLSIIDKSQQIDKCFNLCQMHKQSKSD